MIEGCGGRLPRQAASFRPPTFHGQTYAQGVLAVGRDCRDVHRDMDMDCMVIESAPQIVWKEAGAPRMPLCSDASGRCWICAAPMTRGAPIDKWQGSNYTDQNKARQASATHVCEGCVWGCSWVQPPDRPPAADGKKGLNLRLFSHLYDDRGYRSANKTDKAAILRWLREPKRGAWFAAIADTGQKHVLPWTPVNVADSGGVIRFEERNVRLPPSSEWSVCDALIDLLTLGVTKDEIGSGQYSVRTFQSCPRQVRCFEETYGQKLRGGTWFELALWLSQRDEERYANRQQQARSAAKQDSERGARTKARVSRSRSKPAEALEPVARPDSVCSTDNGKRVGVGDDDVPKSPASGAQQLALFGDR